MRIIAGVARGRGVRAPHGKSTRPTSDRVREAIFDALAALAGRVGTGGEAGYHVLDLFAGSGALAFEALSRGAVSAVLVEASGGALRTARDNALALGVTERVRFVGGDAHRILVRLRDEGARFDQVFLDPPYATDDLVRALDALGGGCATLLSEEAVVITEHSRRWAPPAQVGGLRLASSRRHGDTAVSFYVLAGGAAR